MLQCAAMEPDRTELCGGVERSSVKGTATTRNETVSTCSEVSRVIIGLQICRNVGLWANRPNT